MSIAFKDFAGLPGDITRQWLKKKAMLAQAIPRHPKFGKVRGMEGLYSIRLNDNYRAHLRLLRNNSAWEAVAVGTHKEMGHG